MKTINEIKEYCQAQCSYTDCKGKYLKLAKKNHNFYGMLITPKGSWYCAIPYNKPK